MSGQTWYLGQCDAAYTLHVSLRKSVRNDRDTKIISDIERKLFRILFDEGRHPNKYEQRITTVYSFLTAALNIKPETLN
jgi:hypothetical protein